jgi:RNA polymerase sigma-70 factor (ECF subfamily)
VSRADAASRQRAGGDPKGSAEAILTPDDERELLAAHKAGDGQAIATLLRSYQRRVYSICYRMLRNPEEAADVTQDTLVRVIERIGDFDGRSQLSTWVIRIAINNCLTHLRRERVRRHGSLDAASDASGTPLGDLLAASRELSPPDHVQQEDRRRLLLRALHRLEVDERAMVVLRDLQGLEYQQISEVLEVPIGTVKSRLFRARAALRIAAEAEGL